MGEGGVADGSSLQESRYQEAAGQFVGALQRLAAGYEADPDLRRDLVQEIHLALWKSFAGFDGRCALGTWVYRVAHNTAISHVLRQQRLKPERLATLEEMANARAPDDPEREAGERQALGRLMRLIHGLRPADRQVALLYLEDLDAAAIGEITGLSPGAVATRIHRLKAVLARQFHDGGPR